MPPNTHPPFRYRCGSNGSRVAPPPPTLGTPRRAANTLPPTLPPTPPAPTPPPRQVLTDSWVLGGIRTNCSCPAPPCGKQGSRVWMRQISVHEHNFSTKGLHGTLRQCVHIQPDKGDIIAQGRGPRLSVVLCGGCIASSASVSHQALGGPVHRWMH